MAEFQEVMKQATRMCKSYSTDECNNRTCGLHRNGGCAMYHLPMITGKYASEIERIVMDWATKHPEPRYPTWNEWYKATFPNSNFHTIPCPSMFCKICETSNYHGEVECYECRNQPIPADIAKKLGIKPIGGESDENA